MERMWRKVNHSFSGRGSKAAVAATAQSTDTVSSAGGFGDGQVVVAVAALASGPGTGAGVGAGAVLPPSTATGRRLAASGGQPVAVPSVASAPAAAPPSGQPQKSLSQHVLLNSTASSERRRRRRRKSRPRRSGGVSCVGGGGGGGDNMSSSGGFYSIRESSGAGGGSSHRRHRHPPAAAQSQSSSHMLASSAPSGTVMMYPPNTGREASSGTGTAQATTAVAAPDVSLRQRAVAKLRMFNFHLNWDLHMTHCKPCGPRISSGGGGGNIITRRLCRNRRREDNELYRSNSFKFERFERKDFVDELADTLQKQIAICDDYSLPVDFVKKRPSSFDPCLAEAIPPNPENWTAPSPQSELTAFDPQQPQQQPNPQQQVAATGPGSAPPPPLPAASQVAAAAAAGPANTLPTQQLHQPLQQQLQQHSIQLRSHHQRRQQQQQPQQHPPLPNTIKRASVKLIEGYSDPKDSRRQKKVYHKRGKKRQNNNNKKQQQPQQPLPQPQQQEQRQQQQPEQQPEEEAPAKPSKSKATGHEHKKEKHGTYTTDSSAPQSSDAEAEPVATLGAPVPELNSPDSISDDLVRPLPPQLHRSPRKLTAGPSETSKRNPSPYYYSDLLKPKDPSASVNTSASASAAAEKEAKNKSRQSTASEPPQLTQPPAPAGAYRKSTSLDVPERTESLADEDESTRPCLQEREELEPEPEPDPEEDDEGDGAEDDDEDEDEEEDEDGDEDDEFEEETEPTTHNTVLAAHETPKRYSFTEEGVRIIRCGSPSSSTSDDSDCSECQKRREWHARALALVRKTCNVQPLNQPQSLHPHQHQQKPPVAALAFAHPGDEAPMPPHRLLGPAVCACAAPALGEDLDEYFRPRSIFYVHPHGVHECADCALDCSADAKQLSAQSPDEDDDEMTGRRRQLYETAFDCKVARSDDDLDEVDRVTNHSVLLQLSSAAANANLANGNNVPSKAPSKAGHAKSRLEGKRLKNSKNQALQEKTGLSAGSGTGAAPVDNGADDAREALAANLENVHIRDPKVDQQNNSTALASASTSASASASASQLPMRGYTPSPPSTAPLPMKFPGKHERFFMNSIRSAPNLPASNPAHPRLRDLRLPAQASLRQHHHLGHNHNQQHQHQLQGGSSLGASNDDSLADSAYANPPSAHLPAKGAGSRDRERPRSFVLESGRVLELRRGHAGPHHHVGHGGRGGRRQQHDYSSTESIATSSSGGSMESLRSSTSEGNRSTSSSESRHSTSLSSHSSESGSSGAAFPLRAPILVHSKLHILSPISDKSSQEPPSELSDQNRTQNATPEEAAQQLQQQPPPTQPHLLAPLANAESVRLGPHPQLQIEAMKRRRAPPNKTLLQLADEILGSDSGISLHSREDGKAPAASTSVSAAAGAGGLPKFALPQLKFQPSDRANDSGVSAAGAASGSVGLPQDLRDLPFDMPKLRRRKTLQQDACTSGSATSVDLGDLPFDMPKLRRRLRANQAEINNLMVHSTESSGLSQASSSHSMRDETKANLKLDTAIFRQNLTLNLNEPRPASKFGSLDLRGTTSTKELNLNLGAGFATAVDLIDVSIPLERQGWYHGAITRVEAETTLRPLNEGSFLVRNCESTKQDYSLSLKGAKGFMHMRIQRNEAGQYILGQFSRPFETVPDMIRHFCLNRLPVRGAEHMCLIEPVIAQLL